LKPKPLLSIPNQFLWGIIGLLITIASTFIEAFTINEPWLWHEQGISTHSLKVTYQIGAVLLTGCMGGRNAGAISQIAYITLGLSGAPVFAKGGGFDYLLDPGFGYLLGFIPGAWLCGWLALSRRAKLELLGFSSLVGLIMIQACGLIYLLILYLFGVSGINSLAELATLVQFYTVTPFLGQLAIVCGVAILAYFLRRIAFY
jgi:biotin transport system substrate-specific component